ncbi:hypothetical protein NE237_007024 [Protea cynaroides]|uniref:Uncharacterized protein n=1 Tax=Protea cynaroides TaxID=273540 RepID=A0A9Q0KNP0_9MAGN|nr:hypothetical protein NE237_007024 [Protea cynaroides]
MQSPGCHKMFVLSREKSRPIFAMVPLLCPPFSPLSSVLSFPIPDLRSEHGSRYRICIGFSGRSPSNTRYLLTVLLWIDHVSAYHLIRTPIQIRSVTLIPKREREGTNFLL